MPLKWNGLRVRSRVIAASKLAIDEVTSAAVAHAKDNHPWQNQTGTLEGSLQMRPATAPRGTRATISGYWGSFTVGYAIFLELGTEHIPAMPYLRPAADATYPLLAGRIRAHFEALA
jgi:hypothetical protein